MKQISIILCLITLTWSVRGQLFPSPLIEKEEQTVKKLLEIVQAYSYNSSEARSVGLYQLDSLLQGTSGEEPEGEAFSEVNYKSKYTYTERGYPDEAFFYYWDGSRFHLYSRYAFEFSSDGKIEDFLWQYWDVASSKWVDYVQNVFHYNNKGQLEEDIYFKTNYLKVLEPQTRILFRYDTPGNLLSRLDQEYFNGHWIDQFEQTYLYDADALLRSNSSWIYQGREEPLELRRTNYTYNKRLQPVLVEKLTYDYFINELSTEEVDTFMYDSHNRLSQETQYQYPLEDGWLLITKTVYTYGNSSIPLALQNSYSDEEGNWIILSQCELTLDQNQDISTITLFSSSEDSLQFQPRHQYKFGRSEKLRLENLNVGSAIWLDSWVFQNLSVNGAEKGAYAVDNYGVFEWNSDQEAWMNTDEAGSLFFFYSSTTTSSSKSEAQKQDFNVYPNPASRLIVVETGLSSSTFELYLYDMNGRRIFRKAVAANERLMLPVLPEGIYVLQLWKGRDIVGSRRVMIRH